MHSRTLSFQGKHLNKLVEFHKDGHMCRYPSDKSIPVKFFLVPSAPQAQYQVEMEVKVALGLVSNGNRQKQITSQMSKQTLDDKPAEGEVTWVVFDPDGVSGSLFFTASFGSLERSKSFSCSGSGHWAIYLASDQHINEGFQRPNK